VGDDNAITPLASGQGWATPLRVTLFAGDSHYYVLRYYS